jgi:hypothetical protein
VAFWRFNDQGEVLKYDAWIPNLNNWVESTEGLPISNPQFQAQSIQVICAVTQMRCTGPNTQWSSIGECVAALSAKPYGNYDAAWGDNVVCRTIHLVLTQVRPDVSYSGSISTTEKMLTCYQVHCPHVGPSGGGKCVPQTYPDNWFGDVELYNDPLGETFTCKK